MTATETRELNEIILPLQIRIDELREQEDRGQETYTIHYKWEGQVAYQATSEEDATEQFQELFEERGGIINAIARNSSEFEDNWHAEQNTYDLDSIPEQIDELEAEIEEWRATFN
tara:strand:+ start:93 stop:437 length:345 start_codon:yes stop_codon:yes gene_type:complete